MEWMVLPFRHYARFDGRSRRIEFWMWVLFVLIASIVLAMLDRALGLDGTARLAPPAGAGPGSAALARGGILTSIFRVAIFVPNLAVSVRRLHDTDRGGWWVLLPILPYTIAVFFVAFLAAPAAGALLSIVALASAILLIVWYCLPGTVGPNRFGPDPVAGPARAW